MESSNCSDQTPNVAIVVPVYNVEKYITKCLESLSAQTYPHVIFIVVNDGTKDQSARIIKEFIASDDRFIFIEKENGGLCSARNAGINYVAEHPELEIEFLAFIDSDDYIGPDYTDRLARAMAAEQADVALCAYRPFTPKHEQDKFALPSEQRVLSGADYALHYFSLDGHNRRVAPDCFTSLFLNNRMYRWRAVQHLRFKEYLRACEDQDYNIRSFPTIHKAVFVPFVGFFYRKRYSSLSNDPNVKVQDLRAYEGLFADKALFSPAVQLGIDQNYISQMYQYTLGKLAYCSQAQEQRRIYQDIQRRLDLIDLSALHEKAQRKAHQLRRPLWVLLIVAQFRKVILELRNLSKKKRYYN